MKALRTGAVRGMDVRPFFYWINERHRVYLNKEAGKPWPWTDDPLLQAWRYCNVFRELDKVTKWIAQWRDAPHAWFAMAVARQINLPETLEEIEAETGFPYKPWNPTKARKIMFARKSKGLPVFTGSYIITGTFGGDKVNQVVDIMLQSLWDDRKDWVKWFGSQGGAQRHTLEAGFNRLLKYPGFARFMSYEVVSDWRWTRSALLNAPDRMTWANAGPGALRGLMRLSGQEVNGRRAPKPPSQEKALAMMRDLLRVAPYNLEPHVPQPLEMRDIEHSLCEVDKYLRVSQGGTLRNKYKGPA